VASSVSARPAGRPRPICLDVCRALAAPTNKKPPIEVAINVQGKAAPQLRTPPASTNASA